MPITGASGALLASLTGSNQASFNVKSYGAKGDGFTDDTAAILEAAIAAGAAGGGLLWGPAGTYITTQIAVPAGVYIGGVGAGVTIWKRKSASIVSSNANNTGAVFFVNASQAGQPDPGVHFQFLAISDCTIDGNAVGNPGVTNANLGCHGLRANYTDFVFSQNVVFKNCLDSGYYMFGCSKTRSVGCIAHTNGQISVASSRNGFSITGPQDDATNQEIQDSHSFVLCEAYLNTDEGWAVGRNGRISLSICQGHHNGDMAIEGDSGTATADTTNVPASWTITGCHLYKNGTHGIGISNSNVQRIKVNDNVIEDNPKSAITMANTTDGIANITNNIIRNWGTFDSGQHGIIIGSGFNQATVVGNTLSGGAGTLSTGIVFIAQTATRDVTITDNNIKNAGGGGMSITGSVTGTIANNTVNGTVSVFTNGIAISATTGAIVDLDVHNNQALNCISRGFYIRTNGTAAITRLRMRNNTARGNGTWGLEVSEAGGGVITGLGLEGNDFAGNTSGTITGSPAAGFSIKRNNRLSTDASHGRAVLVNGTVTVSTAEVVASDNISLTRVVAGGTTKGILSVGTIVAGTSFVINSTDLAGALSADDDSTVFWEIVH